MSVFVTKALVAAFVILGVWLVAQLLVSRYRIAAVLQLAGLIVAAMVLRVTTNFPTPRTSFGSVPLLGVVAGMFVCIALGIAARYVFYASSPFSWSAMLK